MYYFAMFTLQPLELNNTRKANKEILFFNRVPKVGTQTTMEWMRTLAIRNNFHYHKDRTQKVETIKLTYNEEVIKAIKIFILHPLYSFHSLLFRNLVSIPRIEHLNK